MAPRRKRLTASTKAVVLAAGQGTRMRRADAGVSLSAAQRAAADAGEKGMIPLARPFLEYVISALADAGVTEVCLVIGPSHDGVRRHFEHGVRASRVRIAFAVQPEPRGSADALLAAEAFADGQHVLVVNSDNYYPVRTLQALRELGGAGLAAFERGALVRLSNIEPGRVGAYAIVETDDRGRLRRIVEKPGAGERVARDTDLIGMNSWSLPPAIYEACRRVPVSPRGERELPQAVQFAVDRLGVSVQVLAFRDGVLDLSTRADVVEVARRLRDVVPRL